VPKAFYDAAANVVFEGGVWAGEQFKFYLMKNSYVFDPTVGEVESDIGGHVAASFTISSSSDNGVEISGRSMTFPNITFTAVTSDLPINALVVSVDQDLLLLAYDDTLEGLPVTPNNQDIQLTWHADGVFRLPLPG
jgi:hypothetical protein